MKLKQKHTSVPFCLMNVPLSPRAEAHTANRAVRSLGKRHAGLSSLQYPTSKGSFDWPCAIRTEYPSP